MDRAPAEKKVVVEIDPAIGLIPADPFRLEQVIGNLLENAIKYSAPGDEIAVRAPAGGGSGGAARRRFRAWAFRRPIFRASSSGFTAWKRRAAATPGGTGLGLSIVKHIIGLHGGEVRAESVYGEGTSIVIHLPASSADFPLPEEAAEG